MLYAYTHCLLFVRLCKNTGYYLSACSNRRGSICPHVQKWRGTICPGYYLSGTPPRHEFERTRLSISFLDEGKSEMEINWQLLQTLFILYLYYRISLNKHISLHYAFLLHLRPNYSSSPKVSHSHYGRKYFHALFHNVVIGVKY